MAVGFIYVVENGADRISKVRESDGVIVDSFGVSGGGVGQFNYPLHIDFDVTTGFLYITDVSPDRLIKTQMGAIGWTQLSITNPYGVAYDPIGDWIYVTEGAKRIAKTKIDGAGLTYFGSFGGGVNQFNSPEGLFYDVVDDFLYIADYNNNRIVKTKFGGAGWATLGGFSNPNDIFYDRDSEFIYVTENTAHKITKTKIDGSGRVSWGSFGVGANQFQWPSGIFYDSSTDFIYVSDWGNNRLIKTKIDGTGWMALTAVTGPLGLSSELTPPVVGYLSLGKETKKGFMKEPEPFLRLGR